MKLLLLSITVLFSSLNLSGQLPKRPYEKLQLIGPQPIWYETAFHPGLVNQVSDGHNLLYYSYFLRNFVEGDYVYNLLETLTNGQNWGCYIEKRNIHTGILEWNTKFHETNYNDKDLHYQEIPKKWFIDENNDLIVIGIRKYGEVENTPGNSFCVYEDSARVTYRAYDIMNGVLKEYHNLPNTDSSVANIIACTYTSLPFPNIFRTVDPDVYRYTELMTRDKNGNTLWNQWIRTFKIDKYGHPLTLEDTINLGEFQLSHNLYQLTTDTLVYLKQDSSNIQNRELIYYDMDINKLGSVKLENIPFRTNGMSIHEFKKDYFVVSGYTVITEPSLQELLTVVAYNYDGRIIDYYRVDFFNDGYNWGSINYLPKAKRLVWGGTLWNKGNPIFELVASDRMGAKDTLIRMTSEDPSRTFQAENILEVDGDKILITISEGAFLLPILGATQYDENARAKSLMLFNASDLGLKTVSIGENSNDVSKSILIYPNPATDECRIDFGATSHFKGTITLLDISGIVVLKRSLNDSNGMTLDLSDVPNGLYYVLVMSSNGEIYKSQKLCKIF